MKEELEKIIKNSYSPYSKFQVSAIVVCKDGNKFSGVNVENASYGATICAERSALVNAISHGYKKGDFKELHIKANNHKVATPCFICRQFLEEFFEEDTKIICYSNNSVEEYTKKDLCPHPFGSDNL